jgi:hypothetical protein
MRSSSKRRRQRAQQRRDRWQEGAGDDRRRQDRRVRQMKRAGEVDERDRDGGHDRRQLQHARRPAGIDPAAEHGRHRRGSDELRADDAAGERDGSGQLAHVQQRREPERADRHAGEERQRDEAHDAWRAEEFGVAARHASDPPASPRTREPLSGGSCRPSARSTSSGQ